VIKTEEEIYKILAQVPDPEVPVLNVLDLGVVRGVELVNDNEVTVTITPTYSGCPAMDAIAMQIKMELLSQGFKHVNVPLVLSPAWTTDWITEAGKQKLKAYGIAPPQYQAKDNEFNTKTVPCPICDSRDTQVISEFASTACKSMYKCNTCLEAFDYFKCH
jgi:ring-1,2-phenylacetyl-CoA epoxidase subunit PaaD